MLYLTEQYSLILHGESKVIKMNKTKSLKKKTTGFDILYRVVTAILVVAMYPVFYFGNLFTFEIAHTDISNILGNLGNLGNLENLGDLLEQSSGATLHTTYDSISLHKLSDYIDMFSGFVDESFDFKAIILENPMYRPVLVAAIFIIIALAIGLVILGFAIFSNKIKVITGLSAAGLLCTAGTYISFTNFFANKLLSGEITLKQLFNIDGVILSLIIDYLGDVIVFTLDSAFFGVMFLMLAVFLWSICIMIVNASDEKEKQMKAAEKKK